MRTSTGLTSILGVAVPILVLVVFGNIPGMNKAEAKLGRLTYFNVYFPIIIAFAVAILALISLPDAAIFGYLAVRYFRWE